MPSFVDYNEQLLKYKDKASAAENGVFFDLTLDPKKTIELNPETAGIIPSTGVLKEGLDKNKIDEQLLTDFTPTETKPFPSVNPSLPEFSTQIPSKTNASTLTANQSQSGISAPINYENELTETIPAPTADNPSATKKRIKNRRSEVEIDVPTVFHRAELNSSQDELSGSGKELFSTVSDYTSDLTEVVTITPATETEPAVTEKQIKNRRSDVVLSDTIDTMLNRSELTIPTEEPSAHSDQTTSNKLSTTVGANGIGIENGVYQPSILQSIGNTLFAASKDPSKNTYEEITSENILEDYITRTEKSITGSDLAMFLYSLVPYQLGKAAEIVAMISQTAISFADNPAEAAFKQIGTYRAAMATLSYASYFTMEELTMSFAATPFTLGLLSQISGAQLKDLGNSIKFQKGSLLKFEFPESWEPTNQEKNILGKNKVIGEQQYDIFVNPKSEKQFSKIFDISSYGNDSPNIKYKGGETPPAGSFGTDVSILEAYRKRMEICMNAYNDPTTIANDLIIKNQKDKVSSYETSISSSITKNDDEIKYQLGNVVGYYGSKNKSSIDKMTTLIEELKKAKNKISVGYIYVYPTLQDTTEGGIKKFKIPFQFNPILNESGQNAQYQGAQSLHRLGQAFSYVYTEGQTLTLETEYLMLSDAGPDKRKTVDGKDWEPDKGPQDDFYSAWTPKMIQSVESALRSLVLPLAKTDSASGDIKFHKPPMVKIVMGKKPDATSVDVPKGMYSLLMHPIGTSGKFYHKTYIITNVTISRDQDSPYFVEDEVVTTHGFKVTMNLTEIDHNYISGAPDFGSYYKTYQADAMNYLNATS